MDMEETVISTLFSVVLQSIGIRSIVISRKVYNRCRESGMNRGCKLLHCIAVNIVRREALLAITESEVLGTPVSFCKGLTVCLERKHSYMSSSCAVVKREEIDRMGFRKVRILDVKSIEKILLVPPMIIIDLSLYELHKDGEQGDLLKQLVVLYDSVRTFLTDLNVVLVNPPSHVVSRLVKDFRTRTMVLDVDRIEQELCRSVVVLDPYAEDVLREEDVFKSDCFVLGGVVDNKIPRPYATSLIKRVNWSKARSKRIELWGSKVGVPNRINKVAEVILKTRFEKMDLENAILYCMSKRDKLVRIHKEVYAIHSSRGCVSRAFVEKLAKLFGIGVDEVLKYLASKGVRIVEE